jgi:3',5'-cyclic-AMP phosphodiesterase
MRPAMKLLHLTDLHLRPADKKAYGMVDSNALARAACDAIARLDATIDAIVITGDLADCGLPGEYAQLQACIDRLAPVPVYLIPGNHDRREAMRAALPGLRHTEGFIQYAVEDLPARLIMLDTIVPGETHGELCAARLAWLERTLAEQPARETMIAMHHPPFLTGIAQFDDINLRNHAEFRRIVAAHKQVTRIICGHHHRMIFGNVAQAVAIVGPAIAYQFILTHDPSVEPGFMLEPSAFLLHAWDQDSGFVTHNAYVERFPGPYPILLEPEYPGAIPATAGDA